VEVKYVILFAALRAGSLTLAECADAGLRLLHDGTPVDGAWWEYDRIDEAAAEFRRRVAEDGDAPN
jgi:hypothetical protein